MADHRNPGSPNLRRGHRRCTGRFSAAHGSFHAATLPDGDIQLTIALNAEDH